MFNYFNPSQPIFLVVYMFKVSLSVSIFSATCGERMSRLCYKHELKSACLSVTFVYSL